MKSLTSSPIKGFPHAENDYRAKFQVEKFQLTKST